MENKKTMYPLLFQEEKVDKNWGRENWLIADTGRVDSVVKEGWLDSNSLSDLMEAYTERIVGEKVMQWYGRLFPVLVKSLDIRERISLQVHPDDEIAAQRYDSLGKASLWYITEVGKNAKLWMGFKEDCDAGELYLRCQEGTVEELLNEITPKKGEAYLIEPGTLHAAQDVKVIEIQESSELNFRIYDWGHKDENRPIMLEEALDFINYAAYDINNAHPQGHLLEGAPIHLAERDEFIINKLCVSDPLHIYTEQFESFIVYVCAEGEISIQSQQGKVQSETQQVVLSRGQAVLIPADMKDFFIVPRQRDSVILETHISRDPIEFPLEKWENEDALLVS